MAMAMLIATGRADAQAPVKETKKKFVAKDMDADVNEVDAAPARKWSARCRSAVVNENLWAAFGAPRRRSGN